MNKVSRFVMRPERGGVRVTTYADGARGSQRRVGSEWFPGDSWKVGLLDKAVADRLGIGVKTTPGI